MTAIQDRKCERIYVYLVTGVRHSVKEEGTLEGDSHTLNLGLRTERIVIPYINIWEKRQSF